MQVNKQKIDDFINEMKEERKLYDNLCACDEMLRNEGDKRAVLAFYEMIEHFYGKAKTAECVAKYGFTRLGGLK